MFIFVVLHIVLLMDMGMHSDRKKALAVVFKFLQLL